MAFFDGLKGVVARWLGVVPAATFVNLVVRENTTREVNTLKNELWYRGDPSELEQFYKQLVNLAINGYSNTLQSKFWAATPATDNQIRKFHSGVPRLIVDKLAGIVVEDMKQVEGDEGIAQRWKDIAEDSDFDSLLKSSIQEALAAGDGAFKICIDPNLSQKPMIEFYSGNRVDFKYQRNRLMEVHFFTDYFVNNKRYRLLEVYGRGYVKYKLLDDGDKPVDMATLEEVKDLQDVTFDGEFIMAVPLKFFKSAKFTNRGESIYEGKGDVFDSLDEILSTWLDSVRQGRVKQYIPDTLVPRDPDDGHALPPDVFNQYIPKGHSLAEDAEDKIEVVQPDIKYEGLLASYTTFLDLALQGIISPSTLGIDVKKLDNAEAQREKEKATLYTRDVLIGVLEKTLAQLVDAVLKTQDHIDKQKPPERYKVSFEWGQYASPAFEAVVETVAKAKVAGIMSLEQCIEELYGDSMEDEDKAEEVARLKAEANAATQVDEPAVNDDMDDEDEDEDEEDKKDKKDRKPPKGE